MNCRGFGLQGIMYFLEVVGSTHQVRPAIALIINNLTFITFIEGGKRLIRQVKCLSVDCQTVGPVITGECPANLRIKNGFSLDQTQVAAITKTGNLTEEIITIAIVQPGREVF